MTRPARYWTAWAAATILLGAWLRLYDLGAMEFKGDEQEGLTLAMRLLNDHPWSSGLPFPTHGMVSSNAGVHNPPLYTWIMAALWAPTHDPVAVARLIALINVLCLYSLWRWARRRMDEPRALLTLALCAVSPFAVIFSRKIWPVDLLLPGVLAVLWGIEWMRGPRPWRGVVLLLLAALVAGQLHLSAPIALALLPVALVIQSVVDRRRGEPGLRFTRPSAVEAAALAIAIGLNLFFWIPYVSYFLALPPGTLDDRPRLDVVRPFLLRKVEAQVMPFDLFYFFAPHRDEFLKSAWRSAFYYASVALGAPLYVYGLWRWLRSPLSLPVLGLWWAGVIAVFTLARIPAQPWYPLMLAPLPAVLAAGAFDGSLRRPWMRRALFGWRVAYVAAMLGLTVVTGAWLTDRGGAAGDYGVAYRIKEDQARAVVERLTSTTPNQLAENAPALVCNELPVEVNWIVNLIDPSHSPIPPNLRLCDNWLEHNGRLTYQWTVRLE
jgi:hypothetical protein